MAIKSLAVAAAIALGSLSAATGPAAADGFSFGFRVGEPYPDGGWRDGDWRRHHRRGGWDGDHSEGWRHHRKVQICEPSWKVRRFTDQWGRVYKVVKVRSEDCRWVRR